MEFPTKTTKEFYFGKASLEPTVHTIDVEELEVTAQEIPSIVTVGVAKFKLTPARVIL